MNETVDYVALVEQHLSDEAMARRLQEQENLNPTISPLNPSISPEFRSGTGLIEISSDDEDEMHEAMSLEDAIDEIADRDELDRPLTPTVTNSLAFDDSWDDDEMEDEIPVRRNAVLVHRNSPFIGERDNPGRPPLFGSVGPGSWQVHLNGRPLTSVNPMVSPFARISGNRESLSSYESALHAG